MYNDSAPNMKQLFKKKSTWRQALKCGISWACRRSRPLAGRGRSRKAVPRTVRERRICKLQFEYWAPDQTSYLGACAVVLGHWQSVAPFSLKTAAPWKILSQKSIVLFMRAARHLAAAVISQVRYPFRVRARRCNARDSVSGLRQPQT